MRCLPGGAVVSVVRHRRDRSGQGREAGQGRRLRRRRMTPSDALPEWLKPLAEAAVDVNPADLSRFPPPEIGGRPSAVLVLFGHSEAGPDVLLIERAHDMRS